MARIIIVSNRLPVTIDRSAGQLIYHPSAGGLATGLNSLDQSIEKLWIGWPGKPVEDGYEKDTISLQFQQDDMFPVFLSQEDVEMFYEGFSNKTIWPHFHYFTQFTSYEEQYWESYVDVNKRFAKAIELNLQEGDMVWVHDYQLMLVPGMLRKKYPGLSIGFFLHIPFPSYEIFRTLPWRNEILEGILGADQVGFHTFGYMRHFLSAVYRILGHEHNFGKVALADRSVNIDTFPMGIDYMKYAQPKVESEISEEVKFIQEYGKRRTLILSIDRLDYSKGIPERIYSYGRFLKNNPQFQGSVTLILVVVPSRSNVEEYKDLKVEVDKRVGHVNGELGTFNWIPIRYYYRSFPFDSLSAMYKASHIALITPLRDGMNLVAKEFIASKEDSKRGVLILSEMAGASEELQEAILVNPNDTKDVEKALVQAMEMPEQEQQSRLEEMQKKLKRYEVRHWANSFIQQQMESKKFQEERKTKLLSEEDLQKILADYKKAKKRLLLLDYDGTLVGFKNDPNAASPDDELYAIVKRLVSQEGTKSVIISGRDRHTLGEWFGNQNIEMVSEHGVWLWNKDKWELNAAVVDNWKSEVRPVLDNLVERTPGSFIEEKDFTLAWHYRKVDNELGVNRVREIRDELIYFTANHNLQVLEGNKVVEIRNAGVDKGKAASLWLNKEGWDFILAIGDDHTDEDTFAALPEKAYSIKVGLNKTEAKYKVGSVEDARKFLDSLSQL
ncbi:MAG: bifunctional alpha,alpha-trehalose-phosphate synthase (UDP-forming)/trehalose-phosphatase [Bacteroidota bacterium]